ncbi:hypothetical protein AAG906_002167 [Vitis piasezkii]
MEGENEEDEKFEINPNKDLCTDDLNRKNEDACATSIEVHIIPSKNVDILPLPIKMSRRDYENEPLRALCGYPEHVMKTRTSRERKPSKFKVSSFVHNLRKMGKRQALEVINLETSKLNYFERQFIGIRSIRCYLPTTFSQMILCGSPHPFFDRKTSIVNKYFVPQLIYIVFLTLQLFIPMHDDCPGHWYLCVIDFKNSHIQILDSLRSKSRDEFRFKSVKTVVEFCQTFFKLYDIGKDLFCFSYLFLRWDCGVHVIKHMQTFKNGDSMTASDLCSGDRLKNDVKQLDAVSSSRGVQVTGLRNFSTS